MMTAAHPAPTPLPGDMFTYGGHPASVARRLTVAGGPPRLVHAFPSLTRRGLPDVHGSPVCPPVFGASAAAAAAAAAAHVHAYSGGPVISSQTVDNSAAFCRSSATADVSAVDAWRTLNAVHQTAAMAAAAAAAWGYGDSSQLVSYQYPNSYSSLDARRKNATRESTSTLKAWLYEHIKNPYPTKGEKIMLAIITKMTLTQVSTWFANARRRLKKENKMQWSPRNRTGDDDGNSDDDDVEQPISDDADDDDVDVIVDDADDAIPQCLADGNETSLMTSFVVGRCTSPTSDRAVSPSLPRSASPPSPPSSPADTKLDVSRRQNVIADKPRIWSLADVATSGTTPSGGAPTSPRETPREWSPDVDPTSWQSLPGVGSFQPWKSAVVSFADSPLPVSDGLRQNNGLPSFACSSQCDDASLPVPISTTVQQENRPHYGQHVDACADGCSASGGCECSTEDASRMARESFRKYIHRVPCDLVPASVNDSMKFTALCHFATPNAPPRLTTFDCQQAFSRMFKRI